MNGLIRSPPEQAPLSMRNAYTTWPGGVDPTVPLFNTDNQKFGGARRRNTRRGRRNNNVRKSRRGRRNNNVRKSRRGRRNNNQNKVRNARKGRRSSRKSRRSRRHRGGYATCSSVVSGSPSIPMTASVCPEGYFQDKGLFS